VSVGSHHHRPNRAHEKQLEKLLADPDAKRMWARPFKVLFDFDCPDGGGYSVLGDLYFVDPILADAIKTGKLSADGMSADETLETLIRHERIEKTLLDSDNEIVFYPASHEYATAGELDDVRSKGGKVYQYKRVFKPFLALTERKRITRPHPQLDAAPYIDDPDRTDKTIIAELRRLGVVDAFKKSRHEVNYRDGKPGGGCSDCRHYTGVDDKRGICAITEGLILGRMWCDYGLLRAAGQAMPTLAGKPALAQVPVSPPGAVPQPSPAETPQASPASPLPTPSPPPAPVQPPSPAQAQAGGAPGSVPPAVPKPIPPPPPEPPAKPMAPMERAIGMGSPAAQAHSPPPAAPTLPSPPPGGQIEELQQQTAQAINRLAEAIEKQNERPIQVNISAPRSKRKRIETRRDERGQLVAHVTDEDE
jgi:hypothetical protein